MFIQSVCPHQGPVFNMNATVRTQYKLFRLRRLRVGALLREAIWLGVGLQSALVRSHFEYFE